MEKRKIVVIECTSSSANYIKDIMDEGYEPVLMEIRPDEELIAYTMSHELSIENFFTDLYPDLKRPQVIAMPKNYDDALALLRELDPVLVIPGSDDGIIPATRLSHDLGLIGNDPQNLPKMRNKAICQQALEKAGLRSIRGRVVSSMAEAQDFYQSLDSEGIVIKPISGGASVGVHICEDRKTFEDAFKAELALSSDHTGVAGSLLLQEYVDGTEYIVNTVSCQGKHKVTAVMQYEKKLIPGKARIYQTMRIISPDLEISRSLIDYTLKMLNVIGITYGPVHSEIMVDRKGPVLIEANCRPCGALMRAMWLDQVIGNHETDVSLQAYLHPDDFLSDPRTILMCGKKHGVIKLLAIDHDMFVKENMIGEAFKDIPGFVYALGMGNGRPYAQTIDLSTASGTIFLAHEDESVLHRSLNEIDLRAKTHPETIYKTI